MAIHARFPSDGSSQDRGADTPALRLTMRIVRQAALGLLVIAEVGCAKSGFSSKNTVKPDGEEAATTGPNGANANGTTNSSNQTDAENLFELPCDLEDTQGTLPTLAKDGASHAVNLQASCARTSTTSAAREVKEPVDIVFVLDVTQSMETTIGTVKSSVAKFANTLAMRGWDARFAAVGFRDTVDHTVPFTDSATISFQVGAWSARGGDDDQENGQDGLRSALELLRGGRASAKKAILFVTDNPSYASAANHADFSVATLAAQMKAGLPAGARLFCSVPTNAVVPHASPARQCDDLRARSGLGGENFAFPLTPSVFLDKFAGRFEVRTSAVTESCSLVKAQVVDAPDGRGQAGVTFGNGGLIVGTVGRTSITIGSGGIAASDSSLNRGPAAAAGSSTLVPLGDAAAVRALAGKKALRVERCCSTVSASRMAVSPGMMGATLDAAGSGAKALDPLPAGACATPESHVVRF